MNYILYVDVADKTISGTSVGCSNVVSVRGDILADNVVFSFSESPEGFDLSTDIKRIYYQIPGTPGVNTIVLTDVDTSNGAILVYWPLTQAITKVKGVVFFTLSIEHLDDDGAIEMCWNTVKNALTIRESLVHTGAITATDETIYEIQLAQLASSIAANTANIATLTTSKQDALTFDEAPTEGSTNPVTSGGVFTALEGVSEAVDTLEDEVGDSAGTIFTDSYSALGVPVVDSTEILADAANLMTGESVMDELAYVCERLENGGEELVATANGEEVALALATVATGVTAAAVNGTFAFRSDGVASFYLYDGTWASATQAEVEAYLADYPFIIYAAISLV